MKAIRWKAFSPLRSTLEVVGGCRPTNEAPCVGSFIAASFDPMFLPLSGSSLASQRAWRQVPPTTPFTNSFFPSLAMTRVLRFSKDMRSLHEILAFAHLTQAGFLRYNNKLFSLQIAAHAKCLWRGQASQCLCHQSLGTSPTVCQGIMAHLNRQFCQVCADMV